MKHRGKILAALVITLVAFPLPTDAISLFSPFGGKVKSWNLSCIKEITLPVLVATAFSTLVTVEKIEVGEPSETTAGLLRIDLVPIPNPNVVKRNFGYFVPGTNVLGNSINLCDVCKKIKDAGETLGGPAKEIGEKFCKSIPAVGEFLDVICSVSSKECPVTNLVYQIGSGSPIGGIVEGTASNIISYVCTSVADAVPLVGSFLKELCP
ncbi:MAG: hypothetical protein HYU81_01705 [Candidatus Brennerbacteria bacterium]|nr:hypothetical protein [Candidatus Brennerbacteria bacterium]